MNDKSWVQLSHSQNLKSEMQKTIKIKKKKKSKNIYIKKATITQAYNALINLPQSHKTLY